MHHSPSATQTDEGVVAGVMEEESIPPMGGFGGPFLAWDCPQFPNFACRLADKRGIKLLFVD